MTGRAVTSDERLRPDCSRCAALCCVAFAFERSADFALEKAAGEPCPNLDACGGCRIYVRRLDLGFGGCVQHDCHGAGQRVVQETFGGRSWLAEPNLLGPMSSAFATMWEVHKLLALLAAARRLPLPPEAAAEIGRFETRLEAVAADAAEPAARGRVEMLSGEIAAFLPSLRAHLGR